MPKYTWKTKYSQSIYHQAEYKPTKYHKYTIKTHLTNRTKTISLSHKKKITTMRSQTTTIMLGKKEGLDFY